MARGDRSRVRDGGGVGAVPDRIHVTVIHFQLLIKAFTTQR